MGRVKRKQPSLYRRFVEAGIQDIDAAFIESKNRSPLCIGSDSFHDPIEGFYQELVDGYNRKEDVSFQRISRPRKMDTVLDCVCQVMAIDRSMLLNRQRNSMLRPIAARALCDHAGMTQREVAEVFNLSSGCAVSKQLVKLSKAKNKDKKLQKTLADIDRAIMSNY